MTAVTLTIAPGMPRSLAASITLALGFHLADEEVVRRTAARLGWDAHDAAEYDESTGGIGRQLRESLTRQFLRGTLGDPWSPLMDPSSLMGGRPLTASERWTEALRATLTEIADEGDVVIMGRGAQAALAGRHDVTHIRVTASAETRARRLALRTTVPFEEARRTIARLDRALDAWHRSSFGIDWRETRHYALTFNTDLVREDDAVAAVVAIMGSVGRWSRTASLAPPAAASGSTLDVDCSHPLLRATPRASAQSGDPTPPGYWCDVCGTPFMPAEATRIRGHGSRVQTHESPRRH